MPGTPLSKPTVLVVDPSAESRVVLCELLGRTGIETIETGSAVGAALAIERQPIKAILIDGDTLEAAELLTLAKSASRKNTLIVAAGTNRPKNVSELGVLFVRKPYHYRELVHKIWTALGADEAQARAAA